MKTCLLVFLSLCCVQTYSWRAFHRGRKVGGNLGQPAGDSNSIPIKEEWFDQILDHFTPSDTTSWKQRFFTNEEFYNGSLAGPVFLLIGGEGEASSKWMTQGTWIDYAKEFGALCFQLEHRYYGKSRPTKDLSTKNLQYLTSQQALADLAYFISSMNQKYNMTSDVKWIAFGGSYPGSLAAWLRNKYPHLVAGAMSASGPLLAQVDFQDYFKVVVEALSSYSEDCLSAVKQGTSQLYTLLRHMVGQRNVNEKFHLCDPIEKSIENKNDVSNFFETIAGNFAGIVQYNKDNRMTTGGTKDISIDTLCGIMTNETNGMAVARLAAVNDLIMKATNQTCLDYKYEKMILASRNVSWESNTAEGGRQWTYQTCTEFGFFQSSTYPPQIFGDAFPVEFFIKQCVDIFGPKYNEGFLNRAVDRTNVLYGGLDIDVSNVVFVHGSIDPWHALGITKTLNQKAPAIYIEGTAHCANMYPEREEDLPQLKAARVMIGHYIDSWIRLP